MNMPNPDRNRLLEQSISTTLASQNILCPILDRHLIDVALQAELDRLEPSKSTGKLIGGPAEIIPSVLTVIDPEVFLGVSPKPIRTMPELATWAYGLSRLKHLTVATYADAFLISYRGLPNQLRSEEQKPQLQLHLQGVEAAIGMFWGWIKGNHVRRVTLRDFEATFIPHSWYHMVRLDSGLFFTQNMSGTLVNISPFSPEFVPELYRSTKDVTPDHPGYRGATWEQRVVKECPLGTKKIKKVKEPRPQPLESADL